MSYCREEGKDQIIFVTKEDHQQPSTAIIKEEDDDDEPGLILENGDINWNCPCLGGMASGPCGYDFREAFSCFHYSTADPKGSDCFDQFKSMQDCMSKFPELYGDDNDKGGEDQLDLEELEQMSAASEIKDNVDNSDQEKSDKEKYNP